MMVSEFTRKFYPLIVLFVRDNKGCSYEDIRRNAGRWGVNGVDIQLSMLSLVFCGVLDVIKGRFMVDTNIVLLDLDEEGVIRVLEEKYSDYTMDF